MSAQRNKTGVPGVPLGALEAIQDENVRMVLRAIVDGWNVRNGNSGTGDAAFITKSDLPNLAQTVIKNYMDSGRSGRGYSNVPALLPGEVSKIVNEVEASVLASQLWNDLGTRINRIDLSLFTEQRARIAAVQQVADDLAEEAATRLGFDEVVGSKVATLETVTETQAELITGLTTRIDDAESTIIDLRSTTSEQATQLASLTTRMGSAESNITSLQTTTADQAQSLNSLTTRVGSAESNISQLNTTTANQANVLVALTTALNNAQAAISTESTTRANADNAITSSVNTQFTQVNQSLSAIQTQQTTLSNSVASLSQSNTTLQSSVNNLSSSLATEAQTRATADGTLFAQYTVKVDLNGYVSGYGLASTAVNGTPRSDFIVRADRFAIGSPSGPGITPRAPFTVLTTTDSRGNLPGVYITETFIKKASIDTALIADGTITSAKIADSIQSTNYIANRQGWRIDKTGTAYFNRLAIYGIVYGSIYVPDSGYARVVHNSGRFVVITLWADERTGIPSLAFLDENSFQIYLTRTSGGTVYYAYF
jgi:phage shock protein A